MAVPIPVRVLEGHVRAYRHTWRGTTVGALVRPTLFLAAIGVGLGSLVDERTMTGSALPATGYLAWFAPGLLTASLMQAGAADGSFPVAAGMRWVGTYHAAVNSPVRPRDLFLGNLGWSLVRSSVIGLVFVAVAAAFGAMPLSGGSIALLPAVLTGLATCAAVSAFVVTREDDQTLAGLNRFVIVPLFLFSGTFFPIDQLPEVVRPAALVVPLWHGVELARAAATGTPAALPWAVHLAVVVGTLLAAVVVGTWAFTRSLRR